MKTLKERAEQILVITVEDCEEAMVDGYLDQILKHIEESNELIKDLVARNAELEAQRGWKPIAEMPEELKDGKSLLFMEFYKNTHKVFDTGFCDEDGISCKHGTKPTHYMEIPEVGDAV